ncbi:tRNA glutamyl-Q(34) synthetase GluQRS [Synechococcus sp. MU1642]|uniref:tRNA glutamyl-Q(34) synthetase GluQRS n=1 Tax=Synechococcus sp. MU1642 TaxID=2508348 RepID=UPI001CF8115A|nr:tRNA glutamyl-Q(34) synthetase GluQRS [Synechococcus sp. MU1642]MCB4407388.1 tRNA glutamyl-Q(34) synthetase GluQRS [Synechococcus sp. MU1642]
MVVPVHLQQDLDAGRVLAAASGYRGRFAPSPTGVLHLGNLQTALLSWLAARQAGGAWLLRIDDLDTPRNSAGAIEAIQSDLRWLGLEWDGPVLLQSKRRGLYHSWLSWLRRSGRLFSCRCSRRELADHPIYPGFCRTAGHSWGWQQQRLPSWRLRVADHDPHGSGDVVLRRADGFIAYQLATVIDELSFGITDVVRGADLREALPAQRSLFAALGESPPQFRHGPLLRDARGQKLSKREASSGLEPLRTAGLDAAAVIGRLASGLQLLEPGKRLSAPELLEHVTQQKINAVIS